LTIKSSVLSRRTNFRILQFTFFTEFILDPNTYKWGDERRLPLLPGQGEFVGLDHHIQLKESTLQTLKNPETGEEVSFRKVIVMVSEKEG
jgi:hypothetical protein